MSNSIGTVFYGFPLTEEIQDLYKEAINDRNHPLHDECGDDTFYMFETLYAAYSSDSIGFWGKKISTINSNEGSFIGIEDLLTYKYQISLGDSEDWEEAFNLLPVEIRDLALPIDLYIIWSSS